MSRYWPICLMASWWNRLSAVRITECGRIFSIIGSNTIWAIILIQWSTAGSWTNLNPVFFCGFDRIIISLSVFCQWYRIWICLFLEIWIPVLSLQNLIIISNCLLFFFFWSREILYTISLWNTESGILNSNQAQLSLWYWIFL